MWASYATLNRVSLERKCDTLGCVISFQKTPKQFYAAPWSNYRAGYRLEKFNENTAVSSFICAKWHRIFLLARVNVSTNLELFFIFFNTNLHLWEDCRRNRIAAYIEIVREERKKNLPPTKTRKTIHRSSEFKRCDKENSSSSSRNTSSSAGSNATY